MAEKKLTDYLIEYIRELNNEISIEYDYKNKIIWKLNQTGHGKQQRYYQRIVEYKRIKIETTTGIIKELKKKLFMANSEIHNKKIMRDWEKHYSAKGKIIAFSVFMGEDGKAEIIRHPQITDTQLRKLLADGAKHMEEKIKKSVN